MANTCTASNSRRHRTAPGIPPTPCFKRMLPKLLLTDPCRGSPDPPAFGPVPGRSCGGCDQSTAFMDSWESRHVCGAVWSAVLRGCGSHRGSRRPPVAAGCHSRQRCKDEGRVMSIGARAPAQSNNVPGTAAVGGWNNSGGCRRPVLGENGGGSEAQCREGREVG